MLAPGKDLRAVAVLDQAAVSADASREGGGASGGADGERLRIERDRRGPCRGQRCDRLVRAQGEDRGAAPSKVTAVRPSPWAAHRRRSH